MYHYYYSTKKKSLYHLPPSSIQPVILRLNSDHRVLIDLRISFFLCIEGTVLFFCSCPPPLFPNLIIFNGKCKLGYLMLSVYMAIIFNCRYISFSSRMLVTIT